MAPFFSEVGKQIIFKSPNRKSANSWAHANFLGVPVQKSQTANFFVINPQIANPQTTKYCTNLFQNSPKRHTFKSILLFLQN